MVLVDLSDELKCGVADSLNLRVAVMKKVKQVGGRLKKIKIMKDDGYFLEDITSVWSLTYSRLFAWLQS